MASLRAKNGIICLSYWDKGRGVTREKSLKLKDNKAGWVEAKRILKRHIAEAELGLKNKHFYTAKYMKLSEARDYYIKYKTTGDRSVSQSTIDLVHYSSKKIINCIGDVDLDFLDKDKFDKFIDCLKNEGRTVNSIHIITSHLLPVYNLCKKEGCVTNFYFYATKREEKPPKTIKKDDLEYILKRLKALNTNAYNIIYFMFLTGFRKSSALALTWDMIDTEKKYIRVPNVKGKRNSDLFPIGDELLSLLKSIPSIEDDNRVFVYTHKRMHFWERTIDKINKEREYMNEEIERCGGKDKDKWQTMPNYTIHQIRKTFLSNLINGEFKFEEVAYLAGHKDIRTTRKHYLEFNINKLRDKLNNEKNTKKSK